MAAPDKAAFLAKLEDANTNKPHRLYAYMRQSWISGFVAPVVPVNFVAGASGQSGAGAPGPILNHHKEGGNKKKGKKLCPHCKKKVIFNFSLKLLHNIFKVFHDPAKCWVLRQVQQQVQQQTQQANSDKKPVENSKNAPTTTDE